MNNITVNYDSVGEYVAAMSDMSRQAKAHVASQDIGRSDFFWTRTFAEACELWQTGWKDGAERVAKYRDGFAAFISAAKQAKAKQFAWDVTGDFIDVGRYLTGEPECFGGEQDEGEANTGRVVSIRLNNCVSASVEADTICARGLAVLVAVDLLEACGIRCEVVIGTATKAGYVVESNVTVKRASEMAEPSAIAFNVAHPSFFRRFGFRFMELNGHSPSGCLPCPMTDYGKRQGVIEIDEILSGVRLSQDSVMKNVLTIASKCGLTFDAKQMEELVAAAAA
jgi:hypothetical protein